MILVASHGGDSRPTWWLPPGFRIGTAKRNVLVALGYLLLFAIGLDLLRGLLA